MSIVLEFHYNNVNTRPVFQGTDVLNFEHIPIISKVLKPPSHENMPRQFGLQHILQLRYQERKTIILTYYTRLIKKTLQKTLFSKKQCRDN
jgi:hypothetical protein